MHKCTRAIIIVHICICKTNAIICFFTHTPIDTKSKIKHKINNKINHRYHKTKHTHTRTHQQRQREWIGACGGSAWLDQSAWIGVLRSVCLDRRAWIGVLGSACLGRSSDGIDRHHAWIGISERSLE